jgi:hypothetical protein|nr:MAG TPA: hypothetical protein [Inoviridae sp.]
MIIKVSPETESLLKEAQELSNRFLGIKFLTMTHEEEQQRLAALIADHSRVMSQLGYTFFKAWQSAEAKK